MKLLLKLSALPFLMLAPSWAQSRVTFQYVAAPAPGVAQFAPSTFSPYIMAFAWSEDSSVDGFIFTVTFSTPAEPHAIKTKILSAVIVQYGTAAISLGAEAIPSSIHVTAKAFSTRKDIADAETSTVR